MINPQDKSTDDVRKTELEQAAQLLETSTDYKIMRRFKPQRRYSQCAPQKLLKIGLYVDVETTGLDPVKDKIVEFGAVKFTYDDEGNIFEILEEFSALDDPGISITKEASEVHKIFDDDVKGKRIDDAEVSKLLENTSLVIAHNAKFDRILIEERFPGFDTVPWACSCTEIPWEKTFGSIGAKLGNVLAACGYFYDGHRALCDCQTGIHALTTAKAEGRSAFSYLLESLNQDIYLVLVETPKGKNNEDMKTYLRSRGYKWAKNSNNNWIGLEKKFLDINDVISEMIHLRETEDKYNPFIIRQLSVNAYIKYSARIPSRETWQIIKK